MIPISPSWIVAGVVVLAAGGYILHCEHTKNKWAEAKAIAARQDAENAKQAMRDHHAKERSDENYQRNMARLAADVKRLRNASPSLVPAAPAGSPDPDRICFSRPDLAAALRGYRDGVVQLLGEGAAAVEGLDEAKVWALRVEERIHRIREIEVPILTCLCTGDILARAQRVLH